MASTKYLMIGDLVSYAGLGTEEYCKDRQIGIVMNTLGIMVKVKWASPNGHTVWYQTAVLKRVDIEKIKKNNLTKSSKMLNYNSNSKEFKWK